MSGTTYPDPQSLEKPECRRLIAAFDPGETTGFCLMLTPMEILQQKQLKTFKDVTDVLDHALRMSSPHGSGVPLDVVYERFQVAPSVAKRLSWDELPAPQVIGVIRAWCEQVGIEPAVYSPSQKRFFSNDKLRSLGVYWAGHEHACDATRHALYHSVFTLGNQQVMLKYLPKEE